MKTPEVIKKVLLECDEGYACKRIECPYDDGLCLCNGSRCMMDARKDALAYIQQLEDQIANAGKMATMKDVAESLKHMGFNCCYGEE